MEAIIMQILVLLGGLLGEYVAAFLRNWEAQHGGDNALLDYIYQKVESAALNPMLKSGEARWQWVLDTTRDDLLAQGKQVADSLLNTLIELALQKFKRASVSS